MGVTVATTRVACNTSTGNQDITTTDLGGLTPKAAYFAATSATSDGTAANHWVLSTGAATGTGNRWAVASSSEHGIGATDSHRRMTNDECVMLLDPADGTIDGEADFVSFIEDGVRINWGDAPAAAYLLTVVLFAGTDLSALADSQTTVATTDNTLDITDVGFEPDQVIFGSHGALLNDTTGTFGTHSVGIADNGVGVVQPQENRGRGRG